MCNSKVFEEPISNCYAPTYYTRKYIYKCENGTLDNQFYPYKNEYCEMCNRDGSGSDKDEQTGGTFRDIFSPYGYSSDVSEEIPKSLGHGCSVSELKDTYTVNL